MQYTARICLVWEQTDRLSSKVAAPLLDKDISIDLGLHCKLAFVTCMDLKNWQAGASSVLLYHVALRWNMIFSTSSDNSIILLNSVPLPQLFMCICLRRSWKYKALINNSCRAFRIFYSQDIRDWCVTFFLILSQKCFWYMNLIYSQIYVFYWLLNRIN